jgi:signal transduction histidine kinase
MSRPGERPTWSLRGRIGRLFTLLTIGSSVLLGVVIWTSTEFITTGNAAVSKWEPAIARTQRVLTDLVDQETGVRGYALTHDPNFLAPYRTYRAAQTRDLARLRGLIADDHDLAVRVDSLELAAKRWQREIAEPSIRGIAQASPSAVQLAESARAKDLFDQIRSRAATLTADVSDRADDARSRRRTYLVIFVGALGVTVGMLLTTGVLLWRGLHRWVLSPIDRLADQTRVVAGGDTYREIHGTGPQEVLDLAADVEEMRLQIAGQLAQAKEIQEELRTQREELARSNDDLQQFAYVASHDLSEPLRKVANFCQLLERQYGPQLDDRARQYIDFAVDGAKRMQRLISDLLSLSRVGRVTEQFVPVDLGDALDLAVGNLADRLEESGARIERLDPLPTVKGDQSLLTSLFENLVGNAVKYRREDVAPAVRISVEDADTMWSITVQDNGIGIEEEYAERIFVVFQRLHLRDRYGGTGIGLALCRKIVEFHGGRIWLAPVESAEGATFRFTIPKGD